MKLDRILYHHNSSLENVLNEIAKNENHLTFIKFREYIVDETCPAVGEWLTKVVYTDESVKVTTSDKLFVVYGPEYSIASPVDCSR